MEFDLGKIFGEMGIFQWGIVLTLATMAVASLAVFVERLWVYGRSRRLSRNFAREASDILQKREFDNFVAKAEEFKKSPLANMLSSSLKTYLNYIAAPVGNLSEVELTRRELARQREATQAELKRGLSVLASVGSVAPFVGLLGTVVGIIAAFEGIAREGSGGLGAVSAGIAEALIVTAIGLLVAIPAVLAFNFLSTKVDGILLSLDQSGGEFLDFIEHNHTARQKDDAEALLIKGKSAHKNGNGKIFDDNKTDKLEDFAGATNVRA